MNWPWVSRRAYDLMQAELFTERERTAGELALLREEVRELAQERGQLLERLLQLTVQEPPPPVVRRAMRVVPQRMSVDLAGKRLEREFRRVAASAEFLGKGDA
jgi:hypothetical protein